MRFVVEISDPIVMEYIVKHAERCNQPWERSLHQLVFAGYAKLQEEDAFQPTSQGRDQLNGPIV